MILALDTASEFGSVALVDGGRVVDEILLHSRDGFGHIVYDQLARLLARNGVALTAIDCFAAASGPGAFTGLRVGLSAVKGLAAAEGKPAAGISNLKALALFGTAEHRATFLDARRGEIYGAVYRPDLEVCVPEVVAKFPDWLRTLPPGVQFVSPDPAPFRALIGDADLITAPRALAGAVGRIAERLLVSGRAADPAALDANYVRRSDAELFWKE